MVLILHPDQRKAIFAQAEAAYPEECCGLLLGTHDGVSDRRWVQEHRPLENRWSPEVPPLTEVDPPPSSLDKRTRYWIDPQALMTAQKDSRDRGWIILGVYHSHPDHPAVPSERDRRLAWPDYSYPIVSVVNGKGVDLRSWRLDDTQQFQPESILSEGNQSLTPDLFPPDRYQAPGQSPFPN